MKKIFRLLMGCLIASVLFPAGLALTIDEQVTPLYVQEHPKEWSVKVTRGKDALIDFTFRHDVATAMYHVAHLAIYRQGKLIATSDTPVFGKKRGNVFHFSITAEDVATSEFNLSDSPLAGTGDDALPIVGSIVHQFQLRDFVPKPLRKSVLGK